MLTDFQIRVYEAVSQVPKGRVSTYKIIAGYIGCGSSRAVGQALRKNPFAPEVPCHRVIASDLSIGGFKGGKEGAAVAGKQKLLADEDVYFVDGRLKEKGRIYKPG